MIAVLFVDDNALAARALERYFAGQARVRMCGWVTDEAAAAARVGAGGVDVVLLDLEMPGVDTIGMIGRLTRAGARVVVYSGHCRAADVDRALDAGAGGYICKDEPTGLVLALIERAAKGELALSPMAERAFLGK